MKKIVSLILIFAIITAVFCSCDKTTEAPDDPQIVTNFGESVEGTLRLAYSKADTLDPFTASMSANIQLLGLIYDGLYKLDKTYQPIPVIAKSSIVSGTTVNVTLNDISFSDGTALTSSDVLYSFNKAKESPYYAERLRNFMSATTWTPIFLKNKYNVLDVLREHIHQLQILRKMIETDDVEGLNAAMQRANSIQKIIH